MEGEGTIVAPLTMGGTSPVGGELAGGQHHEAAGLLVAPALEGHTPQVVSATQHSLLTTPPCIQPMHKSFSCAVTATTYCAYKTPPPSFNEKGHIFNTYICVYALQYSGNWQKIDIL